MNFQTNSEILNVGAVGYTQTTPMKTIQFVNQKKKFFANNQHHKQSEYIYGTNAQGRGGYGNEAQEVEGINETVKKHESHPIEKFWNDYKRQRQNAQEQREQQSVQNSYSQHAVAPPSGQQQSVNLAGKAVSQSKKQQMLMGNFHNARIWSHDPNPQKANQGSRNNSMQKAGTQKQSNNIAQGAIQAQPEAMKQNQDNPGQGLDASDKQQLAEYEAELNRRMQEQSQEQPAQAQMQQNQQPDLSVRHRNGVVPPIQDQAKMQLMQQMREQYEQLDQLERDQMPAYGQASNQQLTAPYGVLQSPKTQQILTQLENPKFQTVDMQGGGGQPNYFPVNDGTNLPQSSLSLEQSRYLQRMNNAALRQQETYKKNVSRHSSLTEKEKYAQRIEDQNQGTSAIYTGGGEGQVHGQSKQPLGKYVSQLEMKDPEARRRLKEMLEFQMKEKRNTDTRQPNRSKAKNRLPFSRPPIPATSAAMLGPSHSASMLPPLNVNARNVSPMPFSSQLQSQTLTPHRQNQGYVGQQAQMNQSRTQAFHSQSPLRGSGRMQMNSQHAAMAAGLSGQRYNDLVNSGPGQNDEMLRGMVVNGMGANGQQIGAMRSYNSQPNLLPMNPGQF